MSVVSVNSINKENILKRTVKEIMGKVFKGLDPILQLNARVDAHMATATSHFLMEERVKREMAHTAGVEITERMYRAENVMFEKEKDLWDYSHRYRMKLSVMSVKELEKAIYDSYCLGLYDAEQAVKGLK